MSEQITTHVAPGETQSLSVYALDKLDANNACHAFEISNFKGKLNPYYKDKDIYAQDWLRLIFQSGPVDSVYGMNGITIESLLAVCKHRLEGFQSGPLACTANAVALHGINIALDSLISRTSMRTDQALVGSMINHETEVDSRSYGAITVTIATRYGISGGDAERYLELERLHALPIDTVYDPTLHVVFGRARGTILETKVGVEARRKFLTDLGVDVDQYPELKLSGNIIID